MQTEMLAADCTHNTRTSAALSVLSNAVILLALTPARLLTGANRPTQARVSCRKEDGNKGNKYLGWKEMMGSSVASWVTWRREKGGL